MANFNTEVDVNPDRGLKSDQQPRILKATYGDGYEQRVAAGINNLPESWSLTWKNRSSAEANKIVKFLEVQGGVTAFDWYPAGYDISSTTTSYVASKLVDTSQYFTARYLNTTVTDSGGAGGGGTAVLSGLTVASIGSIVAGSGYNTTALPLVTIAPPGGGGTTATGTAVVSAAGTLTSVTMTNVGSGYGSVPTVTITSTPTTTTVTAVDSATTLSLAADIMASGEAYTIYPYKKYTCAKWSSQETLSGIRTITATFTRVFEP